MFLLCILEAQWQYRTIKRHDLPETLFEILEICYESCCALLDTFSHAVSRTKVLFNDECAIYRSARERNVVFWSKENPHFTQEWNITHHM